MTSPSSPQFEDRLTPRDIARQKLQDLPVAERGIALMEAINYARGSDPGVVNALTGALCSGSQTKLDVLVWAILEEYLVYRK